MKKFFVALCLVAFCTVSFIGCNPQQQGSADDAAATSTTVEEPAAPAE